LFAAYLSEPKRGPPLPRRNALCENQKVVVVAAVASSRRLSDALSLFGISPKLVEEGMVASRRSGSAL